LLLRYHNPPAGSGSACRSLFPAPHEVRHAYTDMQDHSEKNDADKEHRDEALLQSRNSVVVELLHDMVPRIFAA
jgi:mevalonate pyrophosphate decarboxylase